MSGIEFFLFFCFLWFEWEMKRKGGGGTVKSSSGKDVTIMAVADLHGMC